MVNHSLVGGGNWLPDTTPCRRPNIMSSALLSRLPLLLMAARNPFGERVKIGDIGPKVARLKTPPTPPSLMRYQCAGKS